MYTTRNVAPKVKLGETWQIKYRNMAEDIMKQRDSEAGRQRPVICVIGRAGVGKGSLVNHLLLRRESTVSHNVSGNAEVEAVFEIGQLMLKDIPGYDGRHSAASRYGGNDGSLNLDQFIEAYELLQADAWIIVVNNRISQNDEDLMKIAFQHGKYFCLVRTHADAVLRVPDQKIREERLEKMEAEIRKSLNIVNDLNVRIFKLSIPWPESGDTSKVLTGDDLEEVLSNSSAIDFPRLKYYLCERHGLWLEIQLQKGVSQEVQMVLERLEKVTTGSQFFYFIERLFTDAILPLNPVPFLKSLYLTLDACKRVGLIETKSGEAFNVITGIVRKSAVALKGDTGRATAEINAYLSEVFGADVYEISFKALVVGALKSKVPGLTAATGAVGLPLHYEKIASHLQKQATKLHVLWLMEHITGLVKY